MDFRSFVEELKARADLGEIIESTGGEYALEHQRRGKYVYGRQHDSLAVDVNAQIYTWFSKAGASGHQFETGDVFDWLERYQGLDFWEAAKYLAQKLNVELPSNSRESSQAARASAKAYKARGELYGIAQQFFEKQLWNTPAALAYVRGRGWTDETIRSQTTIESEENRNAATKVGAGLGFSGGSAKARKELIGELQLNGVDLRAPETVAVVGLDGGVKEWAKEREIEAQQNWLKKNRIYGLVDFPRLIYPHRGRGRKIVYFSGRNLAKKGKALVGESGRMKSYNPPVSLVGARMLYFNWLFHKNVEQVVIVEGQADAVTLGQWGQAAIALSGLAADQRLAEVTRKVKRRFLALDADEKGREAVISIGQVLGPLTRIVDWNSIIKVGIEENDDE